MVYTPACSGIRLWRREEESEVVSGYCGGGNEVWEWERGVFWIIAFPAPWTSYELLAWYECTITMSVDWSHVAHISTISVHVWQIWQCHKSDCNWYIWPWLYSGHAVKAIPASFLSCSWEVASSLHPVVFSCWSILQICIKVYLFPSTY